MAYQAYRTDTMQRARWQKRGGGGFVRGVREHNYFKCILRLCASLASDSVQSPAPRACICPMSGDIVQRRLDWSRLVPNSPPNLPQHQTSCIRLNCSPRVPRPSLDCQRNQTRPRKRKTAPQRTKSAPLSLEGDVAARPQPHLLLRFQLS